MAPTRESKHDQKVRARANQLRREGWNVAADVPGFKTPDSIGQNNRIPDIQADKAGHRKLIEVETPQSLNSDADQQATFRRSAGQKRNTTFDIEMTD